MKMFGLLICAVLITACAGTTSDNIDPVCNAPYIRHADDCCLDTDVNNICDDDEQVEEPVIEETVPVEIPEEPEAPPVKEEGDYLFTVNFVEGSPPSQIPDQGLLTFSIIIEVTNIGKRTLPAGEGLVEVGGIINPKALGLTSLSQLRKEIATPIAPGETVSVEFPGLSIPGDAKNHDNRGEIQINFCHPTIAGTQKCISRDSYYEIILAEEWEG